MRIGQREVGDGQPCYIIAEAGTNHVAIQKPRRLSKAMELVAAAKSAGADAIKFQLFTPHDPLFCPMPGDEKRINRWNDTLMRFEAWRQVKERCDELGIEFLASAFQPTAVQWLKQLGVAAYKVASRAAATYPYDEMPGPFIISNGMDMAVPEAGWRRESVALQCISKYPTMLRWDDNRGLCGLSDHSGTIWPGLDAMARGCPVLEIHYAIDKDSAGNDAPVCLTVDQLKLLCEARDGFAALRTH